MADDPQAARPVGEPETFSPDDFAGALASIDVDGALQETAAAAVRSTRRELLRAAPLVGAMGAGLLTAGAAQAAGGLTSNDTEILRFDLALEYLQAGLYTEAERL